MISRVRKIVSSDSGASAVEYGLLVAAIAAAVVVVVFLLGDVVTSMFTETCTSVNTESGGSVACNGGTADPAPDN